MMSLQSIWIMLRWWYKEAATKNWINYWHWISEKDVWLIVWSLYWEAKRNDLKKWAYEEKCKWRSTIKNI